MLPARSYLSIVLGPIVIGVIGGALLAAPLGAAQDPFAPSLRWTHAAQASSPWIPQSLVLADRDNLVWASANVGTPHLLALSLHGGEPESVLLEDHGVSGSVGVLSVAGARKSGGLFAVAQYPNPDALHRRTVVARYEAAPGATPQPAWTREIAASTNGPARIATDELGLVLVAAAWDGDLGVVRLEWLAGDDGHVLGSATLPSAGLGELAVSGDGTRAALGAGLSLFLLDRSGVLHQETLASATKALALTRDGRRAFVGDIGRLRVLAERGGAWVVDRVVPAGANEIAAEVDASDDGRTYAIGWWDLVSGAALRFEMRDGATHAQLYELVQSGGPGALQNLPQAVDVTPDGARAALGAWGDGGAAPELVLVDRDRRAAVLQVDLPGSVQALALDEAGTRVAVAHKNAHANQFATTGAIRIFDTGERELQLRSAPRAGGALELVAREPGARLCLFLIGTRRREPARFAGASGALWLDRDARLFVFPRATDADGGAELSVPLPASFAGSMVSIQAAFRFAAPAAGGSLRLGRTVVDARVL